MNYSKYLQRSEMDAILDWYLAIKGGGGHAAAKERAKSYIATGPLYDFLLSLLKKRSRMIEISVKTAGFFEAQRQNAVAIKEDILQFQKSLDHLALTLEIAISGLSVIRNARKYMKLERIASSYGPGINELKAVMCLEGFVKGLEEVLGQKAIEKTIELTLTIIDVPTTPSEIHDRFAKHIWGETASQSATAAIADVANKRMLCENRARESLEKLDTLIEHTAGKINAINSYIDEIK